MNKRTRQNLIMILSSILITLLMLEGLARCCLPVSSPPGRHSTALGLQRIPGQEGHVVTYLGEMNGHYHINAAGWNSSDEYTPGPHPGTYRIVVIGDSYVEALQVDTDQAYPELLAARLGCRPVEVYRFGMGGMPLSQYAVTLHEVLETYQPDLALVQLVNNDYDESLEAYAQPWGRLAWLVRPAGSGYELVPPSQTEADPSGIDLNQISALRRFLVYNLSIDQALVPPKVSAEEDRALDAQVNDAVDWLLARMAADAQAHESKLMLIAEPERASIYAGHPVYDSWGAHAIETAGTLGIPAIDTGPALAVDYRQHGQRFEFPHDGHWNIYAHQVVADYVANKIETVVCR